MALKRGKYNNKTKSKRTVTFDILNIAPKMFQPDRDKLLRRLSLDVVRGAAHQGPRYSSILNVRRTPSRNLDACVLPTVHEENIKKGRKEDLGAKSPNSVKGLCSNRISENHRSKSDSDLYENKQEAKFYENNCLMTRCQPDADKDKVLEIPMDQAGICYTILAPEICSSSG